MKVSIITAVFNNKQHILSCLESLASQTYPHIEHIIIDGGSTDGTLEVIKKVISRESAVERQGTVGSQESGDKSQKSQESEVTDHPLPITYHQTRVQRVISEPDNGIYDALNKGIKLATGDVIGFLHADDVYVDKTVIEKVVKVMSQNDIDSCYGDLLYVDKNNTERTIRYWKSRPYEKGLFKKGWMPPHPTFFVRRKVYEALGVFNTDFKISADYELMLRFLGKNNISTCYIPEVLVKMRTGGASNKSLRNIILKSSEDLRAMKMHNIGGLLTLLRKNLSKIPQFLSSK